MLLLLWFVFAGTVKDFVDQVTSYMSRLGEGLVAHPNTEKAMLLKEANEIINGWVYNKVDGKSQVSETEMVDMINAMTSLNDNEMLQKIVGYKVVALTVDMEGFITEAKSKEIPLNIKKYFVENYKNKYYGIMSDVNEYGTSNQADYLELQAKVEELDQLVN